jgi:hypothetical protein
MVSQATQSSAMPARVVLIMKALAALAEAALMVALP